MERDPDDRSCRMSKQTSLAVGVVSIVMGLPTVSLMVDLPNGAGKTPLVCILGTRTVLAVPYEWAVLAG
jgi:hypothetical protein